MSRASSAHQPAWYVISLRPLGQHAGVRRAAARFGAACVAVSTLKLEALPARATLQRAIACPNVIVTSPAAARFAAAQASLRRRRGQRWFALGRGTAGALHRAGIDDVQTPRAGSTSEALLGEFRFERGDRVGLVTAPGGRGLIRAALRRRGVALEATDVYRRIAIRPGPARLAALQALPPRRSALLVSSAEAFDSLWLACDAGQRARLRALPCVASSERLRAHLAAQGFADCVLAADAGADTMVVAAKAHLGGRFR